MRVTGISAIEVLEASQAYWFRALSAICHNKFINDFYKSKRYRGSRGFTGILVSHAICYLPQQFHQWAAVDSKRRALWSLNEDILKITVLKTNTPYPSRRYGVSVPALTKRPHRIKDQYAVSRRLNTPYSRYGINIIFWKISNVVPTPRNPQYACITRSSTNELYTPYKDPKREFRSSRRHSKSLSLDASRSPDFNLLFDEEYSEEEEEEAMEQHMSKTRTDYGSGVARPKIDNKDQFELKG
ncbi:hypothetical protein Tco_0688207 [Tanacetum coccineum]